MPTAPAEPPARVATPPLRVAVVGCGAFGRNHLRVYRELEAAHPELVQLAALVEPDPTRRADLAALYNIPAFPTVPELLAATRPGAQSADKPPGAPSRGPGERFLLPGVESMAASPSWVGSQDSNPPDLPGARSIEPLGAPFMTASPSWVGSQNPPEPARPIHAVSICVPTLHHAAVAEQLLLANIDVLVEKPFAATLAEADRLASLAQQRDRILAVGHLERFNPAVTAALAALTRPMFFEAHRLSIFTPRSLDVDVVLDLMIHDLDIVLSLTQSPVKEVRAVGLPILSRKTDIANVRVEFDSGCVANFTASRVSTEQVRKLRLFQPHQYLSLDFARQELLSIDVDPTLLATLSPQPEANPFAVSRTLSARPDSPLSAPTQTLSSHSDTRSATVAPTQTLSSRPKAERSGDAVERPAASSAAPHHPTPAFTLTKPEIPRAEPLRLELEDFLHAVRNRTQPRVPAAAGRAALSLALEINAQIAAHAHRAGLDG